MVSNNLPTGVSATGSASGSSGMSTGSAAGMSTSWSRTSAATPRGTSTSMVGGGLAPVAPLKSALSKTKCTEQMSGTTLAVKRKLDFSSPGDNSNNPIIIGDSDDDGNEARSIDDCILESAKRLKEEVGPREQFLSLLPEPMEKTQKVKQPSVKGLFLKYCLEHSIMEPLQLINRPIEETEDFLLHPQFGSLSTTIYDVVRASMVNKPFFDFFELLTGDALEKAIDQRGGVKIEYLLITIHGWSLNKFKAFVECMVCVADKRLGKENSIWLEGASNAGKSILLDSFCKLFKGCVGAPSNNIRSGFPFESLMNARAARVDEPPINGDNFEMYKSLFGGNETKSDKKYSTNVTIPATPCFISSNTPLWKKCMLEKKAFLNRMAFHGKFDKEIPKELNFGSITDLDWIILLSKYVDEWSLKTLVRKSQAKGDWRMSFLLKKQEDQVVMGIEQFDAEN